MGNITGLAEKPVNRAASLPRLRRAARTLFVEKGYHDTRPQDIAREAGVANGTFYLHFPDKQQAFLDFAEQAQSELLTYLASRASAGISRRQRWQNMCEGVIDFGSEHPGLLQAAFIDPVFIAPGDSSAWQAYDRLGETLAAVLRSEGARDDYDFELISHGICGLLRHAMIYAGRRDVDKAKLVRDLGRFIDQGLGNNGKDST